ncbi:putative Heterogeneous nuclear ribonucleoprotein D-like [Hypsibius exemplaris]|uniref:Heterogeneous nuclear ribonucleoprotein D-like n=1 Tax=Hypsibius exemplaris TaxID=2072580 RepID=A0A1W0X9W2_HYPEX|nr:putative Heterogeneous nuclear ribonucleoprotein D-like [Hypsibius exemplaris]
MAYYANGNGAGGDSVKEEHDKRDAFVGGLSPDTTEADLNAYFSQFGPVLHSVVKRDLTTGLSRGFGFVTFADAIGLNKISSVAIHTLKGKKIDAKAAVRKHGKDVVMKIFVGGVDTAMNEDDIKAYFSRFGKVTAIQWPKDRLRDGAKKNFVFVEFDDANVVETLVKTPKHTIGSRLCDVRKAVPSAPKPPGGYAGAEQYGSPYGAPGYGAAAAYDPAAAGYGGYYGAAGYGAGYGAAAAGGYDAGAYGAGADGYGDPAAAYGGYGDATTAAYGGYGAVDPAYADPYSAAAAPAYDPYGPAPTPTVAYPGAEAVAAYPPAIRGGFRGRGAPLGARGGIRPAFGAPGGARGGVRGFHPYRRV